MFRPMAAPPAAPEGKALDAALDRIAPKSGPSLPEAIYVAPPARIGAARASMGFLTDMLACAGYILHGTRAVGARALCASGWLGQLPSTRIRLRATVCTPQRELRGAALSQRIVARSGAVRRRRARRGSTCCLAWGGPSLNLGYGNTTYPGRPDTSP